MSFAQRTNATTGKQSKSKNRVTQKAPKEGKPTQRQSARPDDRVTHDVTKKENTINESGERVEGEQLRKGTDAA